MSSRSYWPACWRPPTPMPMSVRLSSQRSLLAHLAFDAPLVSRDERAKAFLNRNQDFLGRFKGKAREIIELLVDKYRVRGIEEIAKPEVFRVRPLSQYGAFTAIAELFQGAGNLGKAVDELQVRLYAGA